MKKMLLIGGLAMGMTSCFIVGDFGGSGSGNAVNYTPYGVTAKDINTGMASYCKTPPSTTVITWQSAVNFSKAEVVLLETSVNPNSYSGTLPDRGYSAINYDTATNRGSTTIMYGQGTRSQVGVQGIVVTPAEPNLNVYVRTFTAANGWSSFAKASTVLQYRC